MTDATGPQEPARPDWTGRRLEVEIGPVAHGGHCVARHEGRVMFVRHALPGERVLAEVTEDHGGSFCRADAVEVRTPAAGRVPAPCPVAVPGGCGGCDWQHVAPDAQRELKTAVLREQLQRLADLDLRVPVEPLPGGLLGWRTRTRLAVGDDGRPGFRAHRSHQVIPVADCPLAVPGTVPQVVAGAWRPGAELAVARDHEGTVHISEVAAEGERSRPRLARGSGVAEEHAAGRRWRVAADGFWQVHPAAADTFASVVRDWAQAPEGGVAWDLYGGVGLFAGVLAEQVGRSGSVLVVESSRQAVRDGRANLADLPQVHWRSGRVEHVLAAEDLRRQRPDVVVLDPPRKGAGRRVIEAIARRSPERVVHVACDPAALARDVADFRARGYRLEQIRAFDAFPMTHHFECLALLIRD